jgi:hypothetical protein
MSGNKATVKSARQERVPLGTARRRLQVDGRPGYRRRWINDTGERLTNALEGGYTFVAKDDAEFKDKDITNKNDSINDAVCKPVNPRTDDTKGYLMEIPVTTYNKDQKEKQRAIDKTEDGLRVGADAHGRPGQDGRYVPAGGIKIER